MQVNSPPPSLVSAPAQPCAQGLTRDPLGSEVGPRVGFRGTDVLLKRSVFKEAPVMPFALEPCPGDRHLGASATRTHSAPWCPRMVIFLHL